VFFALLCGFSRHPVDLLVVNAERATPGRWAGFLEHGSAKVRVLCAPLRLFFEHPVDLLVVNAERERWFVVVSGSAAPLCGKALPFRGEPSVSLFA
jgi:hypothetical protein